MLTVAKKRRSGSGFGAKLRTLRQERGMTLAALGESTGMSHAAVSRLERGAVEPTWPTVLKLADALGVSVAEFRSLPDGEAG
jgi:transcriptional regulator with XRE-family HTH domain